MEGNRRSFQDSLSSPSITPDERIRRVMELYRKLNIEEITKAGSGVTSIKH